MATWVDDGRTGHRFRLTVADGVVGDVDLADRFTAATEPVFEPLRIVEYFAKVRVDAELGTVVWSSEADFSPGQRRLRW